MTQTFHFELVSPEEKLISEPVLQAVLPGVEGEFSVGAGHMSLVSSLKPGTVKLFYQGRAEPVRIFIAGGFADVTNTNCTVLAEEAVNVNDIDVGALEKQIEALEAEILVADESGNARMARKLTFLQARLSATGK